MGQKYYPQLVNSTKLLHLINKIMNCALQDEYKSKFLQHKMACKMLIELKQRSLPRLTFLSDQVTTLIVGVEIEQVWSRAGLTIRQTRQSAWGLREKMGPTRKNGAYEG